jgi:hypothetical protein
MCQAGSSSIRKNLMAGSRRRGRQRRGDLAAVMVQRRQHAVIALVLKAAA